MKGVYLLVMYVVFDFVSGFPEPPSRFSFSRFRNAPQTDSYGPPSEHTEAPASGPYPPSGWKPSGDLLLLPGETHSSQQSNYGPPPSPSAPSSNYGAPTTTTTTPAPTTTTRSQELNPDAESNFQEGGENGQYYVLLPDGKLQKVRYSGKKKGRGQYQAQVEYELVDPIRAPVYTYQGVPLALP